MNWQGEKVLVTGAGGFIGSHLAEQLVQLGATTRAFVHYNSSGKAGWLETSPYKPQIDAVLGDITDRDCVMKAMQGCAVVFHLAALIGIPYSYHAPVSYVNTNIYGTLNILQSARELNIERVIHTSTSEVYGTAKYVPMDEKHPLQGQSPYAATKIGADKLAEAYYFSFGLPVTTVRPFNTYGPRQSARAVIPTIITQCLYGNVVCLGALSPRRDLNYVADTVNGFIAAAENKGVEGKTINLGSGREISIGDLVQMVAHLMGKPIQVECDEERVRPVGSEVERLCASNSLANEILGWKPIFDLESGLALTIAWIQEHAEYFNRAGYLV